MTYSALPSLALKVALWLGLGASAALAQETTTPIKHVMFLMQENHSFDNYFGTYPGADGIPAGTCVPEDPFDPSNQACVEPWRIGTNEDVEMDDPDHSEQTSLLQFNEGKMDGFVYSLNVRNQDGRLAMAYYDDQELPYYWNIADEYVLFDRFFSSAAGGSFINHVYWVAAAPGEDGERNTQEVLAETPTIFDRLEEKGISWKFYVQNYEPELNYRTEHLYEGNRVSQVVWVPLLNFDRFLDDPNLAKNIVDLNTYYDDLANGTLPAVAFLVPSGPSEHPPGSVRSGQRFVKNLLQSLMQSRYWDASAFIWSYDDWGGWYDHVAPPQVDEHGYGFRVPALMVSAYAKRGHVDHTTLDYTSVLKFIEENWQLEPLAERDAKANSIASAFDFSAGPREAAFLPFERESAVTKPEPRRAVIYVAYGAGLFLAGSIFVTAMRRADVGPRELEDWGSGETDS